ncbi:hypothetical protein OUZ56_019006 [Daphnia magna]|uniref:Uncharacterized protein n=1 Tax=Daphnia magna TaxID=35525 RepID=A0ABQ9ZAD8_9CRUS|nr:hypothetical protein OUZ56_019006 [Daphnia magna]
MREGGDGVRRRCWGPRDRIKMKKKKKRGNARKSRLISFLFCPSFFEDARFVLIWIHASMPTAIKKEDVLCLMRFKFNGKSARHLICIH